MNLDWDRVKHLGKVGGCIAFVWFMVSNVRSCVKEAHLEANLNTITNNNIRYTISDRDTLEVEQKPLTVTYNFAVKYARSHIENESADTMFFFSSMDKEKLSDALKTGCLIPKKAEVKYAKLDADQQKNAADAMAYLRKFAGLHCR